MNTSTIARKIAVFFHGKKTKIGFTLIVAAYLIGGGNITLPVSGMPEVNMPALLPSLKSWVPSLYGMGFSLGGVAVIVDILNFFGLAKTDAQKIADATKIAIKRNEPVTVITAPEKPNVTVVPGTPPIKA